MFMRFTTGTGILLASLGLVAGSLSLGGAAPAAADGVEPFGRRYVESLSGDFGIGAGEDPSGPRPGGPSCTESPAIAPPSPSPTLSAPPAPCPGPRGGVLAQTGANGERMWLLGALGVALAATGLVARAAVRGRRDH
ncbi:hypothetical protein ACFU3J_32610 [Streptomyces sp. NPDC057411]|uniref:hypothetical protein n=1 Tax=unclassified Streptomyces TaxID=2593676 RepID=UPI003645DA58